LRITALTSTIPSEEEILAYLPVFLAVTTALVEIALILKLIAGGRW
jgi:hypothetical protein